MQALGVMGFAVFVSLAPLLDAVSFVSSHTGAVCVPSCIMHCVRAAVYWVMHGSPRTASLAANQAL